jgi:hypothetical protein
MSAAVCVAAIARAVEDTVMPIAMEYIKTNVSKHSAPEDWRWREAAMTAFGSVVDGPRRATLLPFVQEAFHFLITQVRLTPLLRVPLAGSATLELCPRPTVTGDCVLHAGLPRQLNWVVVAGSTITL